LSASWIEPLLGALLLAAALLDVFLTVLYARADAGFISNRMARLTWRVYRAAARPLGRYEPLALSLCGPSILVVIVLVWALLLTVASGMIIHPNLGTAVRSGSGVTAHDFTTAVFVGGSSMSIVGASDYNPETDLFKAIFLFNSLVGMSVMSLTLTYLMQVYAALRTRNVTAMQVHLESGETGDAAELLSRWGPEGQFSAGYTSLASLAHGLSGVRESHHFYPVLFYFRFKETYYSVSRMALVSLDAVALLRSGLDDERFGWLKKSAAVEQLGRASNLLVRTLDDAFLATDKSSPERGNESGDREEWRRRYVRALARFKQAGLETRADEKTGADEYVRLRAAWDGAIRQLAPALAYSMDQVDPATSS
jgi:hypothetical protein